MTARTITLLLCLCRTVAVLGQPSPVRPPERPFLNLAANHLIMEGAPASWQRLYQRLDDLFLDGRGQLNVVHFGGSHVQADMWTMQLRHRLQGTVPGVRAGRGFIFPYTMAKSNNPYWYLPEYTGTWTAVRNVSPNDSSALGMAGLSVTTHDSLTQLKISFRGEVYPGYTADRVRVLHRMDSSYEAHAWSPDSTLGITRRVVPEEGYTEFVYDRPCDTIHLRFQRTDTLTQRQFTLRGLVLDSKDPGVFVHACGVNGASTRAWLRCQDLPRELALVRPDLVILSIGINDAHDPDFSPTVYEANYRALIARIRSVAPDAAILLTTNTDSYMKRRQPNKNADAVREVMLRLSATEQVAVWDTYSVMGGQGSIRIWEKAGLAQGDRIHLKREGYALLGDLLYTAIMERYGQHLRTGDH